MSLSLKKLLGIESEPERASRAKDPKTPRNKLLKLASDPDASVRICVAHRKDIDEEIVCILIADEHVNVRYALINNTDHSHIPTYCLEELCEDDIEFVKEKAKEILAQRMKKEGIPFFFTCSILFFPAF